MAKETPVTKPIRKSIKIAAQVAQTARFIELMPTPQDFATRICGDVIYMSSLIQKFIKDINGVLDGYSNIPWDYLNNQLYSIMDSANNTLNRAQAYTDYIVDNTLGLAKSGLEIAATAQDGILDLSKHAAQTTASFGAAIASTSVDIIGNHEVAQSIRDGVKDYKKDNHDDSALHKALSKVVEAENKAHGIVQDISDDIREPLNKGGEFVQKIINKLRESVNKMTKDIDDAFGNIIRPENLTTTLDKVGEGLSGYDKALVSQATGAASTAVSNILKNFSIGKFVSAFLGVATNSVLISTGLDQLPPINLDKMLYEFQGSLNESPMKNLSSGVSFDDLVEYDPQKYNDIKESFEVYLKQQREEIQQKKKNIFTVRTAEAKAYAKASKNWYNGMTKEERKNIKSAINEIKKKRNQAKKARQTKKLKDVVLAELKKLNEECSRFSKRLREEWDAMIAEYQKAIKQITDFFSGNGPGDQYVDDLCYDINENVDNIVQLCTVDMPVQMAGSATKAALPYCFGMAVPNYAHNVISFIVDIKIILKFIIDLIKYVMNIINDIIKLARLFLNGLKKLIDMIHQLLDFLGLKWLMDLVKDIVNIVTSKIDETCSTLEGTLSPVYLGDTSCQEKWVKEIKTIVNNSFKPKQSDIFIDEQKNVIDKNSNIIIASNGKITKNEITGEETIEFNTDDSFINYIDHINCLLIFMGVEPIDIDVYENGYPKFRKYTVALKTGFTSIQSIIDSQLVNNFDITPGEYDINKIKKEIENKIKSIDPNYIVAYRAPKFKNDNSVTTQLSKSYRYIDDITSIKSGYDPSRIDKWIYYHSNLKHFGQDLEYKTKYQGFNYEFKPIKGNKTGNFNMYNANTLLSAKKFDNFSEKDKYYTDFMSNAAHVPNNKWLFERVSKSSNDNDKLLDVNGNGILTAYDVYYWYADSIKDDDNQFRLKYPDGSFDDDTGSDNDPDEPSDDTDWEKMKTLNVLFKTTNNTKSYLKMWLYNTPKYFLKENLKPLNEEDFKSELYDIEDKYKLIIRFNKNYSYNVYYTDESGETIKLEGKVDKKSPDYITWEFNVDEKIQVYNVIIGQDGNGSGGDGGGANTGDDVNDEDYIDDDTDKNEETDDPLEPEETGTDGSDDDPSNPNPDDPKPDEEKGTIINQSEFGSVVKVKINGEVKIVWIKNKTVMKGDWVKICIDETNKTYKYFQVF